MSLAVAVITFALLTDVQYGDQPDAGKRLYRASAGKLADAVEALNARGGLDFAIQLGDFVDAKLTDLDGVFPAWRSLKTKTYDVPGNHDFGFAHGPYEFTQPGWRFLVLDGMDLSVKTGAQDMLDDLKRAKAPNAQDWNGGIGPMQLEWLRDQLKKAEAAKERVIVFCHFPVLAQASTAQHLLWNHEAVLKVIEGSPAVAAWFNGHDHNGGYALRNGIHHVTFPGMVESGDINSYTVVRLLDDRIELDGTGSAPSRVLKLR
jgi:manganese-dependent ADP-ribose/CDP-alcohol diphosphatase